MTIKSWDDFMDALERMPRKDALHVRQTFDILLDKEYTAQQLAHYGVDCPITGAENPKDA
jgi:hypothetical protein